LASIKGILETELKDLKEEFVAVIIANSDNYLEARDVILQLTGKEKTIYVSANRTFKDLSKEFKKKGLNEGNFFFIDLLSSESGITKTEESNVLLLESPSELTELGIDLSDLMEKQMKSFFLDGLSTLTLYNSNDSVGRFVHYLSAKIRSHEMKCFILTVDDENVNELTELVTQFSDKVIFLNKQS